MIGLLADLAKKHKLKCSNKMAALLALYLIKLTLKRCGLVVDLRAGATSKHFSLLPTLTRLPAERNTRRLGPVCCVCCVERSDKVKGFRVNNWCRSLFFACNFSTAASKQPATRHSLAPSPPPLSPPPLLPHSPPCLPCLPCPLASPCHMNQDRDLHRIAPSVYVDGFKAYKSSLQSPSSHFILTHYHADHYTGLERGNKGRSSVYGTIHTTSITKKLIDDHHFAADDPDPHAPPPPTNSTLACTLTSHAYATEWTLPLLPTPTAPAPHFLTVVFYPANHCPGAAIVVYRDSGESWWHVHCGDMRYSPKMKLYPHLRPPNKIHTIYLDTTYVRERTPV